LAYSLRIKSNLIKAFEKIAKRDPVQYEAIQRKIKQILLDPHHYKPLSGTMKNKFRVHIMGSFVLVFAIIENEQAVELWDYDHHDAIYQKS
jgi:YafQ family addiction module toxin component